MNPNEELENDATAALRHALVLGLPESQAQTLCYAAGLQWDRVSLKPKPVTKHRAILVVGSTHWNDPF